MMGVQERAQGKLFYAGIDLEKRVRPDHALRRIAEVVDFDFVYGEVADRYGANGNVSVPPPVILKLESIAVTRYLEHWLLNHITTHDRKIGEFLPTRVWPS